MTFFKFHPKEREIDESLINGVSEIIERLYCENKRLCLAFCIGYYTGARVSEIVSLKWDDIDLKKRTVFFRRRAWNKPGTKGSKKDRPPKVRIVPLPLALGKLLCGLFVVEAGWLFANESTGKHICEETLIRELQSWTGKSGFKFTFHDLRHLYASRKVREEGNPLMIAKLLGHSDLKSTMIYTHFDLGVDNSVIETEPRERRERKEGKKHQSAKFKSRKWVGEKRSQGS